MAYLWGSRSGKPKAKKVSKVAAAKARRARVAKGDTRDLMPRKAKKKAKR